MDALQYIMKSTVYKTVNEFPPHPPLIYGANPHKVSNSSHIVMVSIVITLITLSSGHHVDDEIVMWSD